MSWYLHQLWDVDLENIHPSFCKSQCFTAVSTIGARFLAKNHLFIFELSCSTSLLLNNFQRYRSFVFQAPLLMEAALGRRTLQPPQNECLTWDVTAYYATALACHPLVKAASRMWSRSSRYAIACCRLVVWCTWFSDTEWLLAVLLPGGTG